MLLSPSEEFDKELESCIWKILADADTNYNYEEQLKNCYSCVGLSTIGCYYSLNDFLSYLFDTHK